MFTINQEVVCVDDSPFETGFKPFIRKGNTYIVRGLKSGPCEHLPMVIDIGLDYNGNSSTSCKVCSKKVDGSNTLWLVARRFAPIEKKEKEDEVNQVEYTKVVEDIPMYAN